MLVASQPQDKPGMLEVAAASGLFDGSQLEVLAQTIDRHFSGRAEKDQIWLKRVDNDRIVAVAYAAEEIMTDRVWNLLFIAVLPEHQGQGSGGRLVSGVESVLRERACRMLIIETASGDDFLDTRAFYTKQGYEQEGVVRDFYEDGVDKVVFRKLL